MIVVCGLCFIANQTTTMQGVMNHYLSTRGEGKREKGLVVYTTLFNIMQQQT
jgi:hypothetical protein